jgi:hypothetical protein
MYFPAWTSGQNLAVTRPMTPSSLVKSTLSARETAESTLDPTTHFEKPDLSVMEFVHALRDEYDVVVLEPRPWSVSPTPTSCRPSQLSLMVVKWGKTRRQVFAYGMGEITKFGGRIDGVVLSRVDTPKQGYYSYCDFHAYADRAAKADVKRPSGVEEILNASGPLVSGFSSPPRWC